MTPRAVSNFTYREIYWLQESIQQHELEQLAQKISLAGGDGEKYYDQHTPEKESIDYTVDDDVDLEAITNKLRK